MLSIRTAFTFNTNRLCTEVSTQTQLCQNATKGLEMLAAGSHSRRNISITSAGKHHHLEKFRLSLFNIKGLKRRLRLRKKTTGLRPAWYEWWHMPIKLLQGKHLFPCRSPSVCLSLSLRSLSLCISSAANSSALRTQSTSGSSISTAHMELKQEQGRGRSVQKASSWGLLGRIQRLLPVEAPNRLHQ